MLCATGVKWVGKGGGVSRTCGPRSLTTRRGGGNAVTRSRGSAPKSPKNTKNLSICRQFFQTLFFWNILIFTAPPRVARSTGRVATVPRIRLGRTLRPSCAQAAPPRSGLRLRGSSAGWPRSRAAAPESGAIRVARFGPRFAGSSLVQPEARPRLGPGLASGDTSVPPGRPACLPPAAAHQSRSATLHRPYGWHAN